MTSISAYRKWQNDQHQDYDQVSELTAAFPEIEDLGRLSFHQVSEEARIASPKGRFVDYVGGLYYLRAVDTEIYQRNVELSTAGGVVANSGTAVFGTHADDYSIFGEGSFNFTAAFRGILGARLTHDGLDYDFQRGIDLAGYRFRPSSRRSRARVPPAAGVTPIGWDCNTMSTKAFTRT